MISCRRGSGGETRAAKTNYSDPAIPACCTTLLQRTVSDLTNDRPVFKGKHAESENFGLDLRQR